jgi:two-component system heavy metal sensor histidine kinase CusS
VNKPRAKSIRFRLTASYTAVLALTFALIGIGVWFALEHSIEVTADHELRSRLTVIRNYVDGFSRDDLLHLEEEFREESLLSQAGANVRISDLYGNWIFRTPGTENWPPRKLRAADLAFEGQPKTIRIGGVPIRVLAAPVKVGAVQVGLPIDEFEEVKSGFLWLIGLGSPILLMLAALGGYWMSGRVLKPVDEISAAAGRIGAQELSARLPARGVGDELDRLSGVLNDMLARLESAFHRITEFTADASHELRTPVAVIQTTAELMQTRPRTLEEHVKAWSTVRAETERTARLIADLLTLARSDAGKADLEFRSMDLAETVRSAADEMRVMADAKGLQLFVDASEACPLSGDAEALHRAICILLDNAIKFTHPPGEIRIAAKNGGRALVVVSDTGLGIGSKDLPFIFERFYRVSKDRSRKTGGAGLGLSIARWIVEKHGGEIRVESAPGNGSTFSISLPLKE